MTDTPTGGGDVPVNPFDVGVVVAGLVKPDDHSLLVAGRRLKVRPDDEPESVAERYRRAITRRLIAREPRVDDAVWQSLVNALGAQLRDHEHADNQTLDAILHAIDGL